MISRWLGWFSVRFTLAALVVLWTLPTFGLFISSLRDKDSLATTGWWTALSTREENDRARTGGAEDQVQAGDQYVIQGNVFEDTGKSARISAFGDGFLGGELTDHKVGDVVELEDGTTFTLDKEGNYEYTSSTPFEIDRGERFFYRAEFDPRFTLDNYREVLDDADMGDAFINSLTVTIPSTIFPVAIAAFAAYAFSWMNFPGRKAIFIIVVGLLVVPLQMSLIPLLRIYNDLGLVGTYPGIWLAHTGFGLPLAIFLLRNYIGTMPREIIESAKIDGASHFSIFIRLIVPLSVPALASFAIFQFLWVWNDMLVALVFLGKHPDKTVLTVALRELSGSRGDNWEIMTSAAFVSIAMPLVVFFALQRYFVRGLMAGSVKG
ncbi:MAG: carbohydrate ABC transporter permease [Anaerolineae bacterium]|nr:carbohydrate ABC transporter permease [Anaerolineae bacterium]